MVLREEAGQGCCSARTAPERQLHLAPGLHLAHTLPAPCLSCTFTSLAPCPRLAYTLSVPLPRLARSLHTLPAPSALGALSLPSPLPARAFPTPARSLPAAEGALALSSPRSPQVPSLGGTLAGPSRVPGRCSAAAPVLRPAAGLFPVTRRAIGYLLSQRGTGNAVAIVIGGAAESLSCRPGVTTLILKNRKGFVRMALRHG